MTTPPNYGPPPEPPAGPPSGPPYGPPPGPPYGPPPGPPYGPPPGQPYGGPPAGSQNTQGLVGMILGIASIPLLCCFDVGMLVGIAAAIVSWMGLQKAKSGLATNRGQAMAGLICGGIAVGLGVIFLILSLASGSWNFSRYYNP